MAAKSMERSARLQRAVENIEKASLLLSKAESDVEQVWLELDDMVETGGECECCGASHVSNKQYAAIEKAWEQVDEILSNLNALANDEVGNILDVANSPKTKKLLEAVDGLA